MTITVVGSDYHDLIRKLPHRHSGDFQIDVIRVYKDYRKTNKVEYYKLTKGDRSWEFKSVRALLNRLTKELELEL